MKLLIEMAGTKVFVTPKQMETIVDIISTCTTLENKYVGSRNGNPATYIDLLRPMMLKDMFRVTVMSEEEYKALQFFTQNYDENNS